VRLSESWGNLEKLIGGIGVQINRYLLNIENLFQTVIYLRNNIFGKHRNKIGEVSFIQSYNLRNIYYRRLFKF